MNDVIFITGANGFLGTQIALRLIQDKNNTIIALVRAENKESAECRLSRAWWDYPELVNAIGSKIEALCGDVTLPHMGINDGDYDNLIHKVTHIIHTAADLRIDSAIEQLRSINVQGTANVLELARNAHKDHGIKRLSHVSTAYVAGRRQGDVPEDALTDEFGFSSAYEQSKYEGELLVYDSLSELPISIFRPGMIVGDSNTGYIKTFNTLYFPLRLYLTGLLHFMPASSDLRVNMVPMDYVADAITKLTFEPEAKGMTFHLTAPYESLPTITELIEFVREWAKERLDIKLPKPLFMPFLTFLTRWISKRKKNPIAGLLPYFNERPHFLRDNIERFLGNYELNWQEFLPNLLEYAIYMGFMHKSDRTVHEQVLFRLSSKSRPVKYHDIEEGKIIIRSAEEVRKDILSAKDALRSLGIFPGDRIALVGTNSTRYLTIDIAIGLVGAVSVPLYYTSPPTELDKIINASGAKLLFVGAPKIMEKLGEFTTDVPVISFCRALNTEELPKKVMNWDEFLALGKDSDGKTTIPVKFSDMATLRYTSGTTGQPKGVIFRHDNLRWMAECMASLTSWKARNNKISYLSFLPMNHVVEGILGTYSPYYAPAPLDIYFLENFHDLQSALSQVKPTIFFSVPRFYEKVWNNVMESRIGRLYIGLHNGIRKQILGKLLRRAILKKSGLNRCAQLIAGSAPASENLLRSFHQLGIEIHNAYGLTEAPLVTINRLCDNCLGTVGKSLPMTQVQIAEDGEVLVRGPQVTAGYFGKGEETPFKDGWLCTGDLGYITSDGSLVLNGRKKELIITSYGKNIHPAKIEAMFREIPGVSEAMLVGDGKPYCVALLWVKENQYDEALSHIIDHAIKEMNTHVSDPEQAKRWAILNNDLSIEKGDLTANLKLRRNIIIRRLSDVIEAMYEKANPPKCVLHFSGMR